VLGSEIAGVSCLDASDISLKSLINSNRGNFNQMQEEKLKKPGFNRGSHTEMRNSDPPLKIKL